MAQVIYPPIHVDLILHDTHVKVYDVLHLCAIKNFKTKESEVFKHSMRHTGKCWKIPRSTQNLWAVISFSNATIVDKAVVQAAR